MKRLLIAAIIAAACVAAPSQAHAQLLGGLLDTVDNVVDGVGGTVSGLTGGGGGGSLVTANNGPAGDDGLVNLGVGDGGTGSGNLLGLNIGSNTAKAGVRRNGGSVDANLNLLGGNDNLLLAGLDLGGLGLNLGLGLGSDGTGGPGGPGAPGGPGGPGGGSGSFGSSAAGLAALGQTRCSLEQGRQILQVAADRRFSSAVARGWQRAANVKVVPMRLCPSARRQIAQILSQSPKIRQLWAAVAQDALITTSLSRGRHDVTDVFAVTNVNSELTVYVF